MLVGNIEHEYELFKCKEYIESLILPYSDSYDKHFDYFDTFDTEFDEYVVLNLKMYLMNMILFLIFMIKNFIICILFLMIYLMVATCCYVHIHDR